MSNVEKKDPLFSAIREIVSQAREQAYRRGNAILLRMYWEIGRPIVEDEQGGSAKAAYGKAVPKNLSRELTLEFGAGFDESNLRNIRQFYLSFPIRDAVRHELSWTHYRILSRIADEKRRQTFATYAVEGGWDTRTLERNVKTQYGSTW
jgi:hypothetical protein